MGLAVLLAACGGGGGSAEPSASWPAGGSGGTTGLVPAAPAPGAVLVADSAAYRPLRAGTRWDYVEIRSTLQPQLLVVAEMSAGAGGRFVEQRPGATQTVEYWRTPEGDTFAGAELPLGPGRSLRLSGPDLTRELRAGQQITAFDTRRTDIGTDIDGDGRNDGADIASWRVVVGFEDIALPASARPVRALRLDDQVVLRTLSSRGGVLAVNTQRSSSWYRAGVGLVRTAVWADAAATNASRDEQLVGYDGVDRGFGFTSLPRAAGTGGQAVPFGSGYLSLDPSASTLLRAGARGERLGESPAHRPGEPSFHRQLLPTAAGLRMAAVYNAGDGRPTRFELDAIDTEGRLLPGPRAVHTFVPFLNLVPGSFGDVSMASHAASGVLWMACRETDIVPQPDGSLLAERKLVLRRYTADGELLGVLRLPMPVAGSTRRPQVLALADRALVLASVSAGQGEHRLVEVGNDGRVLIDRRYPLVAASDGSADGLVAELRVVGDVRWLVWAGPTAPGSALQRPFGMRLAADGTPLDVADSLAGALDSALPWPDGLRTVSWPVSAFPVAGPQWALPASRLMPGGLLQPGIAVFDAGGGDPRRQPPARWAPLPSGQGSIPWVTLADRTLFDNGYGGVFGTEPNTVYWHE